MITIHDLYTLTAALLGIAVGWLLRDRRRPVPAPSPSPIAIRQPDEARLWADVRRGLRAIDELQALARVQGHAGLPDADTFLAIANAIVADTWTDPHDDEQEDPNGVGQPPARRRRRSGSPRLATLRRQPWALYPGQTTLT